MFLLIIYIISTVTGLILIKQGGETLNFSISNSILDFSIGIKSILGLIFYIVSFLLWMIILSKSETKLSVVFPAVTAIVQTIIIISGVVIFKERINVIQILGIFLAIIGIILITYTK